MGFNKNRIYRTRSMMSHSSGTYRNTLEFLVDKSVKTIYQKSYNLLLAGKYGCLNIPHAFDSYVSFESELRKIEPINKCSTEVVLLSLLDCSDKLNMYEITHRTVYRGHYYD